jgi:hypothetical protein
LGLLPSISFFCHVAHKQRCIPITNTESTYYLIGGPNQIETLRIPLTHESKHKLPEFWEISYQHKWVREHKNAWKTAYGKSPFYHFYDYKFERILDLQITSFKTLQITLIREILPWIGLDHIPIDVTNTEPINKGFHENTLPYFEYYQVFEHKFGHRKDLSIIDLIFHLGPESAAYFQSYVIMA